MATKTAEAKPTCRMCGSAKLKPTSSQQFRVIDGKRRQVVDVACNACGHTWWSVRKVFRAAARKLDAARKPVPDGEEL